MKGKLCAIKKYGIVFGGLIFGYMLAMIAVFCIPNSWLMNNYNMSMGEFNRGSYWALDDFLVGTNMDGQTDKLILSNCVSQEGNSVVYNAMDVNNYARYWHGYLVLVRPLLCLFKYKYIKYMSMILCFVLLCIAYQKLSELLGKGIGVAYVIAMCMGNIICIPLLFQYMAMYYVTVISTILFCLLYQKRKRFSAGIFFLVVGSVTNFLDFLTSPLVSLGLLLVPACLLYTREKEYTAGHGIGYLVHKSVLWVLGYGGTWLAKWCVSSVLLKRNVIKDAIETIIYRTEGAADEVINRFDVLQRNLSTMFPKGAIAVAAALFVMWIFLLVKKHQSLQQIKNAAPVVLLAGYPVVWYFVLANHSQIHSYFTYRTLEITIFAVLAFMAACIKEKSAGVKDGQNSSIDSVLQ